MRTKISASAFSNCKRATVSFKILAIERSIAWAIVPGHNKLTFAAVLSSEILQPAEFKLVLLWPFYHPAILFIVICWCLFNVAPIMSQWSCFICGHFHSDSESLASSGMKGVSFSPCYLLLKLVLAAGSSTAKVHFPIKLGKQIMIGDTGLITKWL